MTSRAGAITKMRDFYRFLPRTVAPRRSSDARKSSSSTGKTTFANLVPRFYEVTGGKIAAWRDYFDLPSSPT